MRISHEIRLASRPIGWPTAANFQLAQVPVPEPGPGQVLVRNQWMSLDPSMRGRMNDMPSYVPSYQVGRPLEGGAIGEVLASGAAGFAPGDLVFHPFGWRELAIGPEAAFRRIDPALAPAQAHLGALGMTGLTAYVGLLDIAGFKPGETVFVSAAAGAVGAVVGQIAKLRGAARVIGSAGSTAKVKHLTSTLGFDAAFNYRDGRIGEQLYRAAPGGIDVYFDNVGGEQLEAAIYAMRENGRIAMCGAVSQYNNTALSPGPSNLVLAVSRRLTLRGFIVRDHDHRRPAFEAEVGPWLSGGRIHADETVVDGLERAPQAFLGMLRGENLGKTLVRLTP